MTFHPAARLEILTHHANEWLDVAINNIEREYPYMPWMVVEGPGVLPSHRDLHPTFFGSFDWHSCVEMYWVAVRLMRLVPGTTVEPRAREVIDRLLTPDHIATEQAFFTAPSTQGFERPYGWGWLLTLQAELDRWNDEDGRRWTVTLHPLTSVLVAGFEQWLPLLVYPQRTGMHANTAFALLRSLDVADALADQGQPGLREAIHTAAHRFFAHDENYPAHYEPSGADFLSPALAEAELMSRILPAADVPGWLSAFLPGLGNAEPVQLFTPAIVSDAADGQLAHLAGLNLSRAASFLGLANALPLDDPRRPVLTEAARLHADTSLGAVAGSDYMLEHWLAAYATLLLTT